jgi:hypothetical protein
MIFIRYLSSVASQSRKAQNLRAARRHAWRTLLVAATFSASSIATSSQVTFGQVGRAETIGAALFDAISANELAEPTDIINFGALQRAIDAQKCPGTTVSFVLLPNRRHATELYAVSSVATGGKLVVGRHFKTTVHEGAADLAGLSASTKSCLILPIDPRAAGLFITELMAAEPTEFHVLEARLHRIQLIVEAGGEVWAINAAGRVQKIEQPFPHS